MPAIIKQPSKRFIDALNNRGFDIQDCPCCKIRPEWEDFPIIKAIRDIERELDETYKHLC